MRKILISIFIFSNTFSYSGELLTEFEFANMKKEYLESLNFLNADVLKKIPDFEAAILKRSFELIEENHDENILRSKYILYTALYLTNTDTAIRENIIQPQMLKDISIPTSSREKKEVLKARTAYMVQLLKEAGKANPLDWRVPRWLSIITAGLKAMENKPLSTEENNKVLGFVSSDMFGLFNAYIGSFQMQYSWKGLEEVVDKGVDLALKRKMPCGPEGKKSCSSSKTIPHNRVTALTIMGDYFIRKYENTPVEDVASREISLKKAKKAWRYANIGLISGLNKRKWYALDGLKIRIKTYKKAKADKVFENGLDWSKPVARKVYHCASCHVSNN